MNHHVGREQRNLHRPKRLAWIRWLGILAGLQLVTASGAVLAAPGDLDPSFGGDGLVTTNLARGIDGAQDVAIQSDGKIVAAGRALHTGTSADFALVRYLANGHVDRSFGHGGRVLTDFAGHFDKAEALAVQADGKIVAVGRAIREGTFGFALARYNTDGSLDQTFSSDGKRITNFVKGRDALAWEVAIQEDGRIIAGGRSKRDFALARYNPNGTLDTSFSDDGKQTTNFGGDDDVFGGVLVQADGRIVALGYSDHGGTGYDFALARYEPDGTLDTSFSDDGKQTTDLGHNDFVHGATLQDDGRIVAGGEFCLDGFAPCHFALARYDSVGDLDTGFGDEGIAVTQFPTGGGRHGGVAVALQADEKLVLGGQVWNSTDFDFGLVRFQSDGSLDQSFGADGRLLTDFTGGPDLLWGLAIQADDRIVAAGRARKGFALARYLPA